MSRLATVNKRAKNSLNDLSSKKWIKFSKSWFVLNPRKRNLKIYHPASFPEELAEEFIQFFTKKGDWVVDPFAGSGSTLVAAKKMHRNSWGIELYEHFVDLASRRLFEVDKRGITALMVHGDSRNILKIREEMNLPLADFCITSPPYWNQLARNTERQRSRTEKGLPCSYGKSLSDLGTIDDYLVFLEQQRLIFDSVYDVMNPGSYIVVVTNNTYFNGRLWPLAFDTFQLLSGRWVPKDERIWCQNDKRLFPFGMFHSYVGNRAHHYCLVFRKQPICESEES